MKAQDLIAGAFERLVTEGRQVLDQAAGWDGESHHCLPTQHGYSRFRTEAMNLVRRSCGEDSDHYQALKRISEDQKTSTNSFYFDHCFGILEAAQRAFDSGLLFNMRALISAEVLGDFIDQAEALLLAGYHVPAASLAGAILEDSLRKLCEKHRIPIPGKTSIGSLNAELAKAEVYNQLVSKRIIAHADIRNNADHGNFDQFKKADVEDMVNWIRNFTADYLR